MEEEAAIEVGVLTENHHSDGMAKDIIDSDKYQFKSNFPFQCAYSFKKSFIV